MTVRNMQQELDLVTVVLLDTQMRPIVVRVPTSPLGSGPLIATRVLYASRAIYDVTNDRILTCRAQDREVLVADLEKFRKLEPSGTFLCGGAKWARAAVGIVTAIAGVPQEEVEERRFRFRVALINEDNTVCIPDDRYALQQLAFEPEDQPRVDAYLATLPPVTEEVPA